MEIKGTITIALKDFQELLDAKKNADIIKDKTRLAAKELQVFLSFLCNKVDLNDLVEEFNRQSKTSTIMLEGGIARIKFKDDKEYNS